MKKVIVMVAFFVVLGPMAFGELCDGVGACNRTWETDGNADWSVQTAVSHDGWNALQSGSVGDNGTSILQTTVVGPGSVSFWWKVSSELTHDVLTCYVNGNIMGQISGLVDWTLLVTPLSPGVNTVMWVYSKDDSLADNADAGWIDQFVVIESVPPTGTVAVNGGQSRTNSPNVQLSLTYDDGNGSGVSGMRFSNNGSTWSSWGKPAATKAWTLSAGDGVKTVRAQFRDKAGNVSAIASDYIALDTTGPTGTIVIDNGNATTGSPTVGLTMTWDDGMGSGVTRMRFSNDGATWSPWEPVLDSKLWTLGGVMSGNYTVRVQFRDRMGNVSDRYSDYIRLDP